MRKSLLRRFRIPFVALAIAATVVGVWVWCVEVPRRQLTSQCMANLSMELMQFVNREGRMPLGIDELIATGQVKEMPGRDGAFSTRTHFLYYVEDVVIVWGADLKAIRDGSNGLVDANGSPAHLIGRRVHWNRNSIVWDDHSSRNIYQAFTERKK